MSETEAIIAASHRMAKRLGMVFVVDQKKLKALPALTHPVQSSSSPGEQT